MSRRVKPIRAKHSSVAAARKPKDPVEAYARDVCVSRIITGRLVWPACERHLCDLADGGDRGLRWDRKAAVRAIGFFPAVLRHSKGQFAAV
jgi:hypothetical protein